MGNRQKVSAMVREELAQKVAGLEHCDFPAGRPCARCYGYADLIVNAALEGATAKLTEALDLLQRWVTPERDMTCQSQDQLGIHLHDETEEFLASFPSRRGGPGPATPPHPKYGAVELVKSWCWRYGVVVEHDRSASGELIDHYDPEDPCPGPHGIMWAAK